MTNNNIIEEFKKLYPGKRLLTFPLVTNTEDFGEFLFIEENGQICLELLLTDTYFYDHLTEVGGAFKNVVDLGGHVGSFTIPLSLKYPETNFYIVEQDVKNYKAILLNSHLSPDNIKPINTIIKGKRTPISVESDDENSGGHKVVFAEGNNSDFKEKGITLKELMDLNNIDQIDFLKMDIEGSEYDVLEKAYEDEIMEKISIISMEYHVNPARGRNLETIFKYLDSYDSITLHRLTERKPGISNSGGYHLLAYRTKSAIGDRYMKTLGFEEKNKDFKKARDYVKTNGVSLKIIETNDS